MALSTPEKIIPGSQLTGSAATYYTAPANTRTIITSMSLCNTTATARTVTIYLIPSGGSASDSNTIVKNCLVPAYDTRVVYEAQRQVIKTAGFIQALADSASAVTLQASGVEVVTGA
jgi:hypothetical protein